VEGFVQIFYLHSTASPDAAIGFVSIAARSALILPLAVAGFLAILAASYLAVRRGLNSSAYKLRNLSPEKIAAHHNEDQNPSVEQISASIIERATHIKRALDEEPSEIETEMCALGYRKCANDMITLTHLVNEEMPGSPLLRRWRLKRCRKGAIESLSAVRESLPPGVLKATRQEK
jgi:hypothetical protein